jgi:hypothetical protein
MLKYGFHPLESAWRAGIGEGYRDISEKLRASGPDRHGRRANSRIDVG